MIERSFVGADLNCQEFVKVDEGSEPDHFSSPIDLYRQIQYQVLDAAAEQIFAKRFEQPNIANLVRLENLLF